MGARGGPSLLVLEVISGSPWWLRSWRAGGPSAWQELKERERVSAFLPASAVGRAAPHPQGPRAFWDVCLQLPSGWWQLSKRWAAAGEAGVVLMHSQKQGKGGQLTTRCNV